MFQHKATYFLMGAGIASLLFALGRTYYLVRRVRQAREGAARRTQGTTAPKTGEPNDRES